MSHFELDARRLLCPMPVIRTQNRIQELAPGDTLVFFTDGVSEAHDGDGEEFGAARLQEAAAAADAADLSAQGLADRLMELVLNFSVAFGRKDDATILVVKIPGRRKATGTP